MVTEYTCAQHCGVCVRERETERVLHNVRNFKLRDGGNFLYFVGEILHSLDLYGLLVEYYGQKWIRV